MDTDEHPWVSMQNRCFSWVIMGGHGWWIKVSIKYPSSTEKFSLLIVSLFAESLPTHIALCWWSDYWFSTAIRVLGDYGCLSGIMCDHGWTWVTFYFPQGLNINLLVLITCCWPDTHEASYNTYLTPHPHVVNPLSLSLWDPAPANFHLPYRIRTHTHEHLFQCKPILVEP
jgi:hypothetical protein